MIDFSKIKTLSIPEGNVDKIEVNGKTLWSRAYSYKYVSFGDSIAAGHAINDSWETDYGVGSQYGENGNTSTAIVPGSYTDLIRTKLGELYGLDKIKVNSFAHSGDTVADLINKLSHATVKTAIKNANIVTLCIGANDVLIPALSKFDDYVIDGQQALDSIGSTVQGKIDNLASTSATSYTALFNKLKEINPNAKYVFSTIYNPYKYLWIEEGVDGFFKPILDCIPQMTILWGAIEVDEAIKDAFINSSYVQTLFDRVNAIATWAENYVSKLNEALSSSIENYKNSNFVVADTKKLFESFPDRPLSADKHYNDLVNAEYTRGYDTAKMDWGKLWVGSDAKTFWTNLINKYIGDLDINGLISELVDLTKEKVIKPDIDPHPKTYGQYVMARAFADTIKSSFDIDLGYSPLVRYSIKYNANGGSGAMDEQQIVGFDSSVYMVIKPHEFTYTTGYHFSNWLASNGTYASAYYDGDGNVAYYYIRITSSTTLSAQWAINYHTLTVRQCDDSTLGVLHNNTDSYNYRVVKANNTPLELATDVPSKGERTDKPSIAYNTPIRIELKRKKGDYRPCAITCNGTKVHSGEYIYGEFNMPDNNVEIRLSYNTDGISIGIIDNSTVWWEAYITGSNVNLTCGNL